MATVHQVSLTSKAYLELTEIKGSLSYSDVCSMLVKEHHELAKMKLEQERLAPQ